MQGWRGAPGARPSKIRINMIFWRKIVIFHTKYPKNVRASLRSAQFDLSSSIEVYGTMYGSPGFCPFRVDII
jgi:hypothetical protein